MFKKGVFLILAGVCLGGAGFALDGKKAALSQLQTELSQGSLNQDVTLIHQAIQKWARADAAVVQQLNSFLVSLQTGVDKGLVQEKDAKRVLQAAVFAAEKHRAQVRKNAEKTPYIIHPIGVADQIMRVGHAYDSDVLIAALLHDSIENTDLTHEEITERFGKRVSGLVQEMTEDLKLPLKVKKKLQIIHAFHQSEGATLIKLSDKLHNLHTLRTDPPSGWTQDRMDEYFQWAQAVIDNLPEVNTPLKQAVHQEIAGYWENQAK